MTDTSKVQVIYNPDGRPGFVVIPYDVYVASQKHLDRPHLPQNVVSLMLSKGWTGIRAWREHLNFTQQEIADLLDISQAAFSQMEFSKKPRRSTMEKVADAFGIQLELLSTCYKLLYERPNVGE